MAVATILAFAFQDWLEGIAILIIILITVIIGFSMELQAKTIARTAAENWVKACHVSHY